jgi:hypothetical protein
MNKKSYLVLQGVFFLLTGFLLILMAGESLQTIKYILLGGLTPSMILGVLTAAKRINKHIEFTYQIIHVFGISCYLLSLIFFCSNFDQLNNYTSIFFMFYAFSEIIFCNYLFNSNEHIKSNILLTRIVIGLICGIGSVVIFSLPDTNQAFKLIGNGIIFSIIGINILIFRPILKNETPAIH